VAQNGEFPMNHYLPSWKKENTGTIKKGSREGKKDREGKRPRPNEKKTGHSPRVEGSKLEHLTPTRLTKRGGFSLKKGKLRKEKEEITRHGLGGKRGTRKYFGNP